MEWLRDNEDIGPERSEGVAGMDYEGIVRVLI
jgi:hypothetical protein